MAEEELEEEPEGEEGEEESSSGGKKKLLIIVYNHSYINIKEFKFTLLNELYHLYYHYNNR